MKYHFLSLFVAFVFLNLTGCQCLTQSHPSSAVSHVVLLWMKDPADMAARRQLIEATETLRKIPGVVRIVCGPAVPSTRPIVDSSFDLGIVMTFRDRQSLKAYETNLIHVKATQEVLLPLTKKVQVYDIARE